MPEEDGQRSAIQPIGSVQQRLEGGFIGQYRVTSDRLSQSTNRFPTVGFSASAGLHCGRHWDGQLCWDDTPAGSTVTQSCPDSSEPAGRKINILKFLQFTFNITNLENWLIYIYIYFFSAKKIRKKGQEEHKNLEHFCHCYHYIVIILCYAIINPAEIKFKMFST